MNVLILSAGLPMGSQQRAEFQRMALVGGPLGRPPGIGKALLGADRARLGSAALSSDNLWLLPAFATDVDMRAAS